MYIHPQAEANFNQFIKFNTYPGRGLVVGKARNNLEWFIIYWMMGRSENSRNRKFFANGNTLRTIPVDIEKITDPSLIIYEAMLDLPGIYIVGNGDQTHTVYETLLMGGTFESALAIRECEPDNPNYTPRITAMLNLNVNGGRVLFSILKANPLTPAKTDRYFYFPAFPVPGYGVGLTTYSGDGDPLPPFSGDPLLLPIMGEAEAVLEDYWNALNMDNRLSIALKRITVNSRNVEILIKNRF